MFEQTINRDMYVPQRIAESGGLLTACTNWIKNLLSISSARSIFCLTATAKSRSDIDNKIPTETYKYAFSEQELKSLSDYLGHDFDPAFYTIRTGFTGTDRRRGLFTMTVETHSGESSTALLLVSDHRTYIIEESSLEVRNQQTRKDFSKRVSIHIRPALTSGKSPVGEM